MALITLANYEWFKQWEGEPCTRRSDDYESIKKTIGQKMVDQASDLFPSIRVSLVILVGGTDSSMIQCSVL